MTSAPTRAAARAVPLSDRTLPHLPPAATAPPAAPPSPRPPPDLPPEVSAPTYDRAGLRPGIVHFGVGGFHRAHQAVYLDELPRLRHTDWGRGGVGQEDGKSDA